MVMLNSEVFRYHMILENLEDHSYNEINDIPQRDKGNMSVVKCGGHAEIQCRVDSLDNPTLKPTNPGPDYKVYCSTR